MTQIITFYVNDGVAHISPWATIEDAANACSSYCDELNTWWRLTYPEDTYMDESSILTDEVTPNFRVGCIPNENDDYPLPSFSGYESIDLVWSEWFSI